MTNDKIQMTNEIQIPNDKLEDLLFEIHLDFGPRFNRGLRFDIQVWLDF
jgi:hypothetical protein